MNPELSNQNKEFLVKELDQVRKDYDGYVEETRRLERYAILVTGLTWSWCASHTDNFAVSLLTWFPAVACALFGLRAAAIHIQARAARQFSVKIESALQLPNHLSWARNQKQQGKGVPSLVAITAYVFWFIVSVGTIVVPLVFSHYKDAAHLAQ